MVVLTTVIAFIVIVLGAYVRLSHAGLGCPDWPGCYGQLTWPTAATEVEQANLAFPERPVEGAKAWKEMVHRYLAGCLVLLVMAINVKAWSGQSSQSNTRLLAGILLGLVLFQAALGMWTVTLKLMPVVVMAHLLGGLSTFGLLWWLSLETRNDARTARHAVFAAFRPLVLSGLAILTLQLMLGGWTSANYSALACPDFPTCQGQLWPETDFRNGFVLWREIGVDYEGGVLDGPSRTAIHMAHRIGALVTFLVLGLLAWRLLGPLKTRRAGQVLGVVLLTQVLLGIFNVILYLPLPNAAAHNATGALLLGVMLWLAHRARTGLH
jgi:cytochrome c oxidase assembly protein subunit 15